MCEGMQDLHLQLTSTYAAGSSQESSTVVLESFYYGRAFAEVLTERVSSALTTILSTIGQRDAEQRQFWRYPASLKD